MIWQHKTLGELCDAGGGIIKTGPFGSQLHESDYVDEGIPVVMPKDIREGRVATERIAQVDDVNASRLNHHALKPGDIVYGRRGDIGRQAFITERERGWLCGTGCLRVTLGGATELDPLYLHYYLRDPEVTAWISNQAIGATMPNLNTSILRSVPIRFPGLPNQRRIAAILSAYDDLIKNNTRRGHVLEEMVRALYRTWFVEFHFPGHDTAKFVEGAQGRRPAGWVVQTVAETFSILGGGTPSKAVPEFWEGGDINWYTPSDITKSGRVFQDKSRALITPEGFRRSSATMFPAYSVMMTSRATIGAIAINTTPATVNQGFIVGLPNERFPLQFMRQWFTQGVEMFIGLASGATFKEISKSTFKKIPLVVPPTDLVQRFEAVAATWGNTVENLERRNANLRRTRDLLLPRLISGELDISALNMRGPGPETEEQAREEAVA